MATVNINVSLDNGSNFSGAATLEDNDQLLAIAKQLADIIQTVATPVASDEPDEQ